jgi:hypothetical protein
VDDPRGGMDGRTVGGPAFQRGEVRFLNRVFGTVYIAQGAR